MYLIKFRLRASRELRKAYEYYEEQQSGLGEEFLSYIEKSLAKIEINPGQFKIFHKEYREFVLKKFPFIVIFFIQEKANTVVITTVFHTSLNPKKKI